MEQIETIKAVVEVPRYLSRILGLDERQLPNQIKESFLLDLYQNGKISLGKVADLLGKSRDEMIEVLKGHKMFMNYGIEEYEKDLRTIKENENSNK